MSLRPTRLRPSACLHLLYLLLLLTMDSTCTVSKKDPVMPDPSPQLNTTQDGNGDVLQDVMGDVSPDASSSDPTSLKNTNHPLTASLSNQQPALPSSETLTEPAVLPPLTTAAELQQVAPGGPSTSRTLTPAEPTEKVLVVLVTTAEPRSTPQTTLVTLESMFKSRTSPATTLSPSLTHTAPATPATITTTTTATTTTATTTPATTTTNVTTTTSTTTTATTTTPATPLPISTPTPTTPTTTTPTTTTTTTTTPTPTPTTTTATTPTLTPTISTSLTTMSTPTVAVTRLLRLNTTVGTNPPIEESPLSPDALPQPDPSHTGVPPFQTTSSPPPTAPTNHDEPVSSGGKVAVVDAVGAPLSRQLVDSGSLVAILIFGLLFLLVTVAVFVAQAYESYRRKDYTQVDYLINGMYTDSGV
ncbi:uncharacterized protein C11orf24 homolog [Antennarius striatus]|uniref:uncharacterized protein C11orf24 homolog n=1 Tax=Antennarius striatus TaxID=241820 RepID=UPI0035B41889